MLSVAVPLFSEVVADAVLDVLSAEEEPFGFCEVVFPPPLFAEEVPVLLPDAQISGGCRNALPAEIAVGRTLCGGHIAHILVIKSFPSAGCGI